MTKRISIYEAATLPPRTFVRPAKKKRITIPKYEVNHPRTSGGPQFSSLTAALRYMAHAIQNGNSSMTISNL